MSNFFEPASAAVEILLTLLFAAMLALKALARGRL
jgi:hypothetical protein